MDLKIETYLPLFFIVLGIGFILGGILNILEYTVLAIGTITIGLALVTTQSRLEINPEQKYYREYVWILGSKWGEKIKYNEVQNFFLKETRKKQVYAQTYKNHYASGQHFNGYLKFSENQKILIGDSSSKDWVLNRIKKMNSNLGVEIRDLT
jgi:hypothetical protein